MLLAQTTSGVPALDFETLLPYSAFGLFAVVAWIVLNAVMKTRSRADERLEELRDPTRRRRQLIEAEPTKSDAVARVLRMATPTLAKPLLPKSDLEVSKLKTKLANAGLRGESAPSIFLGLKFAGLMIGLFLAGGGYLLFLGATQKSLIATVLTGGLFFYIPDIVLYILRKGRQDQIFLGLPDALDLMVVCVESGLGLDQAMRKVAEEMRKTYPVICEEFSLANFQLQMGRPRNEVLHELGVRSGVEDLRSLAAILVQADKFGSSIAQALRVQSDSMRVRRRQLAEEKAAKTAVKLIFPLVLFIFPGIFVVLVGPAAITMMNELFPKMGG